MTGTGSFQRFAAVTAITSFFTALASNILQGIPVHFSPEIVTNPVLILSAGGMGANLLRWGLLLDMLGYYLPLLPLAIFLQHWLKAKSLLWVRFYTTCGLAYILIGALGAVTLAVVQPTLIDAYTHAPAAQRAILESLLGTIWSVIYGGMWNILGELLAGIWLLGMGLLLRSERRSLGLLSIVVGAAALLDSLGNILSLESLAMLGLLAFLLLAPIWALWFGIDLLRTPVQIQDV